ncbi:hypothetical protein GALL_547660 [mine drainage metagenome]|uniref:Uncharacterized protein n=1 Tax=mine drainage metagenome TaxID=410659 RepID=A0A1J5P8B5_9ZZZZ
MPMALAWNRTLRKPLTGLPRPPNVVWLRPSICWLRAMPMESRLTRMITKPANGSSKLSSKGMARRFIGWGGFLPCRIRLQQPAFTRKRLNKGFQKRNSPCPLMSATTRQIRRCSSRPFTGACVLPSKVWPGLNVRWVIAMRTAGVLLLTWTGRWAGTGRRPGKIIRRRKWPCLCSMKAVWVGIALGDAAVKNRVSPNAGKMPGAGLL